MTSRNARLPDLGRAFLADAVMSSIGLSYVSENAASDCANAMAESSISHGRSLRAQPLLANGALLLLSHRQSSRRGPLKANTTPQS
jgi:hypothetical protein